MSSTATESLRIANGNLRAGLARLEQASASDPLRADDLSGLLTKLLCAAECLRAIPAHSTPDTESETAISEYRRTIEELARILPGVHGRLLTEKARLEIAQAHVTATAAWVHANQKTL